MLTDSEAKVTGLQGKIDKLQQKVADVEKTVADKSAECRRLSQKNTDIEVRVQSILRFFFYPIHLLVRP